MAINKYGILIRLFISVLIAHFIIVLGSPNWFVGFVDESYFLDLFMSTATVMLILEYTHHVVLFLDIKYDWQNAMGKKLGWQIVLTGVVPLGLAALSTYLQSRYVYENGVWDYGYFEVEFPASFLFVLIVNLFYVVLNLVKKQEQIAEKPKANPMVIGKRRNVNVPIKSEDIAHLMLRNELIYLTTFDNEEVILPENLDHYQKLLINNTFFRVNRQSIVNRNACKSYNAIENGKIEITLNSKQADPVLVSQKRAAQFRSWIKE